MITTPTRTWQRIVDAALLTLARRGLRKFSMTDVCAEAGVSRGTLYRYFASKDDVLIGIEERLEASLREYLTTAIAESPDPAARIRVLTTAIFRHGDAFPALEMLARAEPGLVLARLADRFDDLAALFQECLHPLLAAAEPVKRGIVSEEEFARLVVQCAISATLLAPHRSATAAELATVLEGLLGAGHEAAGSPSARLVS